MISHRHKFIYSHIPKCAGTTIEVVLKKFASPSIGSELAKENKWWRNKKLFELYKVNVDYFKFSFSRNPFERLVSTFSYFTDEKIPFSDFVKDVESFLNSKPHAIFKEISENRCINHSVRRNISPLKNALLGYHVLEQNYFVDSSFDFIGKVENLQSDFDYVCGIVGLDNFELPQLNRSSHNHYCSYYNTELRDIVERLYRKDLEMFNYDYGC